MTDTAPQPLPYTGIRVVEFTHMVMGPTCGLLLGDLGAEVIKVEPVAGDDTRRLLGAGAGFYPAFNRNKKSVALDLKTPEGLEVARALVASADVVVENFSTGVMERFGLDYESCRKANPELVYCSVSAYGREGAFADRLGFDPIAQAESGFVSMNGYADRQGVRALSPVMDISTAMMAANAILGALVARERTGRGQRVDVSLFRTAFVDQAAEMLCCDPPVAPPQGGRDYLGPSAAERVYHCRDGWICIAARTAAERVSLGAVAGEAVAAAAPAEGPAAWAIAAWCAARTRDDALGHLSAVGVPAVPCLGFAELWNDPLLRASGTVAEFEDPELGQVLQSGPFVTFDRTPVQLRGWAPRLGADGAAILAEIGYPAERIAALQASRVLGVPKS